MGTIFTALSQIGHPVVSWWSLGHMSMCGTILVNVG